MSRYTEYMKEKVRCKHCCEFFSRHYFTYKHINICDQVPVQEHSHTSHPR